MKKSNYFALFCIFLSVAASANEPEKNSDTEKCKNDESEKKEDQNKDPCDEKKDKDEEKKG